jgi:hypothetical protein
MKRNIFLLVILSTLLFSCEKSVDDFTIRRTKRMLCRKCWTVTYVRDPNLALTADYFNGWVLCFGEKGAFEAANGNQIYPGTYTLSESSGKKILDITYTQTPAGVVGVFQGEMRIDYLHRTSMGWINQYSQFFDLENKSN